MDGKQEEIHNILVALLSGDEKEIYNVLYKKKEIDDKTPKLRTEDEKKKLKSLSYKMRKFPKDLIDGIQKKFPFLQRTPKTAEQRKEQIGWALALRVGRHNVGTRNGFDKNLSAHPLTNQIRAKYYTYDC